MMLKQKTYFSFIFIFILFLGKDKRDMCVYGWINTLTKQQEKCVPSSAHAEMLNTYSIYHILSWNKSLGTISKKFLKTTKLFSYVLDEM